MRFRLTIRSTCLQQPRISSTWSISWNTCRPNCDSGLDPPSATTGQQSISAFAMPVIRLVTPGPDAAMQTEGTCFNRLYAWHMNAAACSCRTSIMRMPCLMQDASASSIGPPMMIEESFNALLLQAPGDDFRAGQVRHSVPPMDAPVDALE